MLDELHKALERAWYMLDNDMLDSLIDSMPRRIAAVIAASNWHIRY